MAGLGARRKKETSPGVRVSRVRQRLRQQCGLCPAHSTTIVPVVTSLSTAVPRRGGATRGGAPAMAIAPSGRISVSLGGGDDEAIRADFEAFVGGGRQERHLTRQGRGTTRRDTGGSDAKPTGGPRARCRTGPAALRGDCSLRGRGSRVRGGCDDRREGHRSGGFRRGVWDGGCPSATIRQAGLFSRGATARQPVRPPSSPRAAVKKKKAMRCRSVRVARNRDVPGASACGKFGPREDRGPHLLQAPESSVFAKKGRHRRAPFERLFRQACRRC